MNKLNFLKKKIMESNIKKIFSRLDWIFSNILFKRMFFLDKKKILFLVYKNNVKEIIDWCSFFSRLNVKGCY
jgi:hypothetical protein